MKHRFNLIKKLIFLSDLKLILKDLFFVLFCFPLNSIEKMELLWSFSSLDSKTKLSDLPEGFKLIIKIRRIVIRNIY